jgi:hypothetical protein
LGGKSHSPALKKYPCKAGNTFPSWRKEKLFLGSAKKFPLSAMGFFRIRKERFQRNPGILLTFLIIYNSVFVGCVPQSTSCV